MKELTLDGVTVVGDGARLAGGPKVVRVVGFVVVPVAGVVVPVAGVVVVPTGKIALVVFVPVAVGPYGLTNVVVEFGFV
jgi:hypothetical protein